MSNKSPISPTNLFARIETMKKWQTEHQQRLLEQQSQQTNFLINEQRRMQEAFVENKSISDEKIIEQNNVQKLDIDDLPISSPMKDFNMLLEENLNRSSSPVVLETVRPKRPFLKKGSGLSRFRMTLKDTSQKISQKNKPKISKPAKNPEEITKKMNKEDSVLTWKSSNPPQPSNYDSLLTELCNARQTDPELFSTPVINQSSEIYQQLFEHDLLDELKLFEALEQKVSNSSFCSNSSLVQRLMEHSAKSTPQKKINFSLLQSKYHSDEESIPSPKKTVYFSEKTTPIQEETTDQSDDDSEISNDTNSSINSEDISDTPNNKNHYKRIIYKDAATNTEITEQISTDLLEIRLEELESEIETFRTENARVNKLKTQLENDTRNFEKQKNQHRKEIEEEKQIMKQQLNEEKSKLMKDKQVYDKYIRESREGRSLRQKDREELAALRNHLSTLQEELKLKESKWGATQARLRNQVRQLEKENTALKIDNTELRTKNGKLEATNKQLLSRRPSDTKVLHEINKNLSKLALENKPKMVKSKSETTLKKCEKKIDREETNNENNPNSLNSSSASSKCSSKCSTTQSFESIEREYEKMFGKSDDEKTMIPAAEISYTSDVINRREEVLLDDGSLQITYPNGNIRTISADGKNIVMKYHNGDIKDTCKESGTIRYLYADAQVWHTTYPDRLELLEFANGQIEKRFGDGSSEILFPNGCRRCTSPNGSEEVYFPDGTNLFTKPQTGEKVLTLPNGQKEIHTADHKRREYPDGTVKLLYPDGIQETRYANGRIRLKDKDGNLIMDSANV